jgi:hypothetical protein
MLVLRGDDDCHFLYFKIHAIEPSCVERARNCLVMSVCTTFIEPRRELAGHDDILNRNHEIRGSNEAGRGGSQARQSLVR